MKIANNYLMRMTDPAAARDKCGEKKKKPSTETIHQGNHYLIYFTVTVSIAVDVHTTFTLHRSTVRGIN